MYFSSTMQVFTGLVIITSCLLLVQVDAMKMDIELKCLGEKFDMKDMYKGFFECAADKLSKEDVDAFKNPSTPLKKRMEIGKKAHDNMCIRVCQWKKQQHLFNDAGKLDETKMNEMVDNTFPEAARAAVKTGIKKCYDDHSKDFDEKDNCAGYKPYEGCMKKTVMDACKITELSLDQMQ